jgi:hypothetical protein
MSWSISFIGTPEKIITALQEYSARLGGGQSKVEYDSVLPHLIGLVKDNFSPTTPLVRISASGYGTATTDGRQIERQCTVNLERVYALLV